MAIEVRRGARADLFEVRFLDRILNRDLVSRPDSAFIGGRKNLFVAVDNNQIVGMGVGRLPFFAGGAYYFSDLLVHPASRRQGIATRLLEARLNHARSNKCREIHFATAGEQQERMLRRFFSRKGLVVEERKPSVLEWLDNPWSGRHFRVTLK